MRRSGWWLDAVWLLALGAASSAWCLSAATRLGATFDEPHHLNAGLTAWRTGSNKLLMSAGCMPLPVDVQTLPLYVWEHTRGEPFHPYKDIDAILPVARAANLVFWWGLLVYALLLGRTFGGPWAGRLAAGLVGCDPNFLAHAALATTDISVVTMMLALIYHFHRGQGRGWWPRVAGPGVCYGLATVAKASGMVFGVQAVLALGLCHLYRSGELTPPPGSTLRGKLAHLWHATWGLRKDLTVILLIGFTLVFAYTGCDWGTEPTFVSWAEKLPDGPAREVMVPLSRHLTVFPNAGEALVQQIKHNMRGHGTYLLGRWHPRATWAYFPLALTMKVPVPALVLLLAALVLRPRELLSPVGWVALVLLAFSLNCRVQIGIRFMLTLMATGYVAVAVALCRRPHPRSVPTPFPSPSPAGGGGTKPGDLASSPLPPRGRGLGGGVLRAFAAFCLAATAATSLWVWPHGLGFFNQLWGGPEHGYTRLHDSNYDWGQGLPELKAWYAAHGDSRPLVVWYYGTDPNVLYPPFRLVNLSFLPVAAAGSDGHLAVSVTAVYGNADITPASAAAVRWLRDRQPVGRTQTFLIYDLSPGERGPSGP
ncbi:MAG: glycosyltransferase family 39 protein [Gemmataceae bacterium]|nr:glycosyltransferase family 39 protein [Gemmataceae bacterium]